MRTDSFARAGDVCNERRIALTGREFVKQRGPDALKAFLQATAGVSRVEDVSESERFRVNAAMRGELNAPTPPHHKVLARIGAKAFAKMVRS